MKYNNEFTPIFNTPGRTESSVVKQAIYIRIKA